MYLQKKVGENLLSMITRSQGNTYKKRQIRLHQVKKFMLRLKKLTEWENVFVNHAYDRTNTQYVRGSQYNESVTK